MRNFLIPLGLAFGVALALIIGDKLSSDSMAVILGVAVGVAASVPMSLLLVTMMRREQRGSQIGVQPPPQSYGPPAMPPPVYLLQPGQYPGHPQQDPGDQVWESGRFNPLRQPGQLSAADDLRERWNTSVPRRPRGIGDED